jgi:hypothetical protein
VQEDPLSTGRRLIESVSVNLREAPHCSQVIEGYERLMDHFFECTSRFVGQLGAKAVFERSLAIASRDAALLEKILVADTGLDLTELQAYALSGACDPSELVEASTRSVRALIDTIAELTGDTVIETLVCYIEGN